MNCPINGDNHKYFLFKTVIEFEPFPKLDTSDLIHETSRTLAAQVDAMDLFRRVEYAYLGCNCGSTIKTQVAARL